MSHRAAPSINRWASAGGVAGVAAVVGLFALVLQSSAPARASDEVGLDELEFLPGTIARLGDAASDQGAAAPTTTAPSGGDAANVEPAIEPAAPEPTTAAVSTDVDAPARPKPRTPAARPTPSPSAGGSGGGKLPGPPTHAGRPFGDPSGWDDLTRDGDPWATAVLEVMAGMKVQGFARKVGDGDVRFQISVCKDGSIDAVTRKGGSAATDLVDAVVLAVGRLRFPPIPAELAAQMPTRCAKIRYTFVWSSAATR